MRITDGLRSPLVASSEWTSASRAGEPRKALEAMLEPALDLICGKPKRRR